MAQVFATTFPELKKVGTMVNRDELRAEILDRLLAQPGYARIASDILADWQKAQELFGEEQSYARVSALRMLRRSAETGNPEPLADALWRLGQRLNTDDPWEKGVEHDYVAMIADYVNHVGVDAFLRDPQPILTLAGLTKKTSHEVSKGIFDSQARAVSPEILRARLLPYFQFQ